MVNSSDLLSNKSLCRRAWHYFAQFDHQFDFYDVNYPVNHMGISTFVIKYFLDLFKAFQYWY